MIDRERFEQLAALAVAGEATPAERAELDIALRDEPALAGELSELRTTDRVLRAAVEYGAPAQVLAGLEVARREALASRLAAEAKAAEAIAAEAIAAEAIAAEAIAADAETVVPFQPAIGRTPVPIWRAVPAWLAVAASVIVVAYLSLFFLLPESKSGKAIAVLAPRGETGLAQPTLIWDTQPGQRYDVWILPSEGSHMDAPALFVGKGVLPPVAFSDLQPGPALKDQPNPPKSLASGQDYRLLVCLANAGRIAGTAYSFRTAPDAEPKLPPADFATAKKLAAAGRPGDALTVLLALPSAERARAEVYAFEAQLRAKILSKSKP